MAGLVRGAIRILLIGCSRMGMRRAVGMDMRRGNVVAFVSQAVSGAIQCKGHRWDNEAKAIERDKGAYRSKPNAVAHAPQHSRFLGLKGFRSGKNMPTRLYVQATGDRKSCKTLNWEFLQPASDHLRPDSR